jgi:hypothetical protein
MKLHLLSIFEQANKYQSRNRERSETRQVNLGRRILEHRQESSDLRPGERRTHDLPLTLMYLKKTLWSGGEQR